MGDGDSRDVYAASRPLSELPADTGVEILQGKEVVVVHEIPQAVNPVHPVQVEDGDKQSLPCLHDSLQLAVLVSARVPGRVVIFPFLLERPVYQRGVVGSGWYPVVDVADLDILDGRRCRPLRYRWVGHRQLAARGNLVIVVGGLLSACRCDSHAIFVYLDLRYICKVFPIDEVITVNGCRPLCVEQTVNNRLVECTFGDDNTVVISFRQSDHHIKAVFQ